MPLEVIGAGFGRTGTSSLKDALDRLGFPCYHMQEVVRNKANRSHLDFWWRLSREPAGTQADWEQVFALYRAAVDFPACAVWRELMVAYPQAKIIMTLHPGGPEAWYESVVDTIYFTESLTAFKLLGRILPFARKFGEMNRRLAWKRMMADAMPDRDKAIARYEALLGEVKAEAPPERLLVFQVDQGWGPLCAFLGAPTPSEPFPRVNDRAQFRKLIRGMILGLRVMVGLSALLALGALALALVAWLLGFTHAL